MNNNNLQFIQDQIGYQFKNTDILQQAFVRRSYAKENGGPDNEILEFIGDKILDIVVIRYMVKQYGCLTEDCPEYDRENDWNEFLCDKTEGELTDLKRKLVEKKTLAARIDELGLADFLIMGKSDIQNHVENEPSVKEDLFEAVVGAITIDSEWNFVSIQDSVEVMLNPEEILSDSESDNYVGLIQEWTERRENRIPWFHYEEGSFELTWYYPFDGISQNISLSNSKDYSKLNHQCLLNISEKLPVFRGFGRSNSEARKAVCKLAYENLIKRGLLWSIRDEIDNPNEAQAINQLETLARRGYFSLPTYKFDLEYDNNGSPIWHCECHIKESRKYYSATDCSKKKAKKFAAFGMLKDVLE